MSKQAIIFHGMPSKNEYMDQAYPSASNSHWLPWLQKQLLINDWFAHTPEIKDIYAPTHEAYLKELNRYELDENTTLVGHSCGGGFLVRYLTENPHLKLDKIILVAPWLNLEGSVDTNIFKFGIDPLITDRCNQLIIVNSSDDMDSVQSTVKLLLEKVDGIEYVELENKGHFTQRSMGTDAFPELLERILS